MVEDRDTRPLFGLDPFDALVSSSLSFCETCSISRLTAHLYRTHDIEYGPSLTVPFGAKLQMLDDVDSRWFKIALPNAKQYFIQKGDVVKQQDLLTKNLLPLWSTTFLGLPYTWGGRTSFVTIAPALSKCSMSK